MKNSTIAARFQAVSKRLGGRMVLNGITLDIAAGEITALLGPNGAGKTTCVGVLTGRLRADNGSVELFGLNPRLPAARARMGVMLQQAGLPDVLSVEELVTLHAGYYRNPRSLRETLEVADVIALSKRRIGKLSGGELRRLQYALAIVGRPDLLVLDEPTTGIDHDARRGLWRTIRQEADMGAAVMLTTHYLEEADALADRIVVIVDGRIVADGTPESIKNAAAGTTITFRTEIAEMNLSNLPGVSSLKLAGTFVTVVTIDVPATMQALLNISPPISDLTVSTASLESAVGSLATSFREANK